MPPFGAPAGKTIEQEWRSTWRPVAASALEIRRHVGQSAEGFHAGVEVGRREAVGPIAWGDAQPTPEMARLIAGEMESVRREEIENDIEFGCDLNASEVIFTPGESHRDDADARIIHGLAQLKNTVAAMATIPSRERQIHRADIERALVAFRDLLDAAPGEQERAIDIDRDQSSLMAHARFRPFASRGLGRER
jgi:hypothetical protein